MFEIFQAYLWENQAEPSMLLTTISQVVGTIKDVVNSSFEALVSLSLPHEPQFEHIHITTTLKGLVSCVICHVVKLVLLEQVTCSSTVTLLKQSLQNVTDQVNNSMLN